MSWWQIALWGLAFYASPSVTAQDTATLDTHDAVPEPTICIVIRTYWRHGLGEVSLLQRLIDSLKRQTHTRCGQVTMLSSGANLQTARRLRFLRMHPRAFLRRP